MKAIYINRYQGPDKKKHGLFLKFLIILIISGGGTRLVAPYFITEYVNKVGDDKKGLRFNVSEVTLKIFESKVGIGNLRVFNKDGTKVLMELTDGMIDVDPIRFLKKENLLTQTWKSGEVILSKYLYEELNALKNQKKTERDIYFQSLYSHFELLNIRQIQDENTSTLMSLRDVKLKLSNVGVRDSKEATIFHLQSLLSEGGRLILSGKILLDRPETPWDISGVMLRIKAPVLEKLAGKKLPIEIAEADLNAKIKASSSGAAISGTLTPDIKEFKLKEEKGNTLKRTVARVSNYVLEKLQGTDEKLEFEIPFTLKENFTLDVDQTLKKIVSP